MERISDIFAHGDITINIFCRGELDAHEVKKALNEVFKRKMFSHEDITINVKPARTYNITVEVGE